MITQRIFVLALFSCVLAACGGGGGGSDNSGGGGTGNNPPTTPPPGGGTPNNPPPEEPGPTAEERSAAQNARLRMFQDGDRLIIDWMDEFDNERSYQLERRVGDGDWQVASPELGPGTGGRMQYLPTITVSGSYRLMVRLDGYSLPLHAALDETEFPLDLGPSPMTIAVDQSEPIRGNVQVSMQNVGTALSVSYQLDNVPVAQSSTPGTFAATLLAEHLLNGQRTLTAQVQKTQGLWISVERQLQIENPDPAVVLSVSNLAADPTGPLRMTARASSAAGIFQVAFFANDVPVSVVTAPDSSGRYITPLDRTTLPTGPNVFRAVATDYNGVSVSMEQRLNIDHYPSLQVSGLFDGMIASNGSVDVQATFGDDAPGATLTILVGDRRIVQTQTSPLNGSYALDGIAAGEYPVLVRVKDTTGKVSLRSYQLIVPATGLSYELIATDVEDVLGTGDGALLYRNNADELILRNAAAVTTTVPPRPNLAHINYQFSDGWFIGYAQSTHVYAIAAASGQTRDLTPTANMQSYVTPDVRGSRVSWIPIGLEGRQIMVHDLQTAQTTPVLLGSASMPSVATSPLVRHDLFGAAGAERLMFSSSINGASGIFTRALVNGTPELLLASLARDVQTDGTHVMWHQYVDTQSTALMTAPMNNPTAAVTLSPAMYQSFLENGVICWLDRDLVLHVNDGSTSTQLAEGVPEISENTLADGRLIFRDGDEMRVWTAADGERVWLNAVARDAIQADGVAYFLTGSSGTLYRVTLP